MSRMHKRIVPLAVLLGLAIVLSFFALPSAVAAPPQGFQDTTLILALTEPSGIAFTPDGRMLIIERGGTIRVVQQGASEYDATPFHQLSNINTSQGERGLVGIALDPNYASNNYYYLFYTANSPLRDRVSRFHGRRQYHCRRQRGRHLARQSRRRLLSSWWCRGLWAGRQAVHRNRRPDGYECRCEPCFTAIE